MVCGFNLFMNYSQDSLPPAKYLNHMLSMYSHRMYPELILLQNA